MSSFGKLGKLGRFGVGALGAAATIIGLFLAVGVLHTGRWEADRTILIAATPQEIFPYLDSPRAWYAWTPLPDSGLVWQGPASGPGARASWNDPKHGDGSFEILEAKAPTLVRYQVAVQHGTMLTRGTVLLSPASSGTRVSWTERGDFGHNPLMGYWALAMNHLQGRELGKDLVRLAKLVGDSTPTSTDAPASSLTTPAASPRR